MIFKKVPVSVITGFLGSGKTSLIKNLIENTKDKRLAIIINEFGTIGVDGDLVKDCDDENCQLGEVVELNNGCLCCTVADDFLPAFDSLLNHENKPDHIIIETSGLALPKPLIKAFQWPEVRSKSTVDGVITVIDTPAYLKGIFAHDPKAVQKQREEDDTIEHENPLEELFEDQLSCGDLVILNKCDLLSEEETLKAEKNIKQNLRAGQKLIKAENGKIDSNIIIGIEAGVEDDIDLRPSHHDNVDDHEHDDFESFDVEFTEVLDIDLFKENINKVISRDDVLRIKGFVRPKGKKANLVIQGVGRRVDYYYEQHNSFTKKSFENKIVVIGFNGIDEQEIKDIFSKEPALTS